MTIFKLFINRYMFFIRMSSEQSTSQSLKRKEPHQDTLDASSLNSTGNKRYNNIFYLFFLYVCLFFYYS